jgi:hypothetical protein
MGLDAARARKPKDKPHVERHDALVCGFLLFLKKFYGINILSASKRKCFNPNN